MKSYLIRELEYNMAHFDIKLYTTTILHSKEDMDENTGGTTRNGDTILSSAGIRQSNQLLPNDTLNRTTDRTCIQKLTIPTLETQDHTNASMWWWKFVQVHKNEEGSRSINYDEQQGNTTTIPWSTWNRNERYFYLGNRTERYHCRKQSGKENWAHYHSINFIHSSDYILRRKGMYTKEEPISLTQSRLETFKAWNGKTVKLQQMYGNEY